MVRGKRSSTNKKDENFVRSYGLFSTIQDCIGASIAWPYPFISVVHED
ncbi:hypothetical protein Hdeb2414_s0013g00403281 [Helianthus debilis subsp. tardiflorus]